MMEGKLNKEILNDLMECQKAKCLETIMATLDINKKYTKEKQMDFVLSCLKLYGLYSDDCNEDKYYYIEDEQGLFYSTALYYAQKEGAFITRPEWTGFHFIDHYGNYIILLKTGEILVNPEEVYGTHCDDWCIVQPKTSAYAILEENNIKL